jgi:uncharacterized Fe-S cluster protein YjdI
MMEEVRGKLSVLRFDGKRCIHSRQCVLSRPDVFVPNVQGERIHPDAATPEEIAKLTESCPSGASRTSVSTVARPLHVTGSLEIVSGTGRTLNRTADAWLCRCGHSKNKPCCDGSHRKAGWKSE